MALAGPLACDELPLMPATARYVARLEQVSTSRPALLAAHAYVRYFGDLSGGAILAAMLARTLGLGPDMLSFYNFETPCGSAALKERLGADLDRLVRPHEVEALVAEAVIAFEHNIALSCAVEAFAFRSDPRGAGDQRPVENR
jgi:heme oxygenase